MSTSVIKQVEDLLGAQSQSLLGYTAKGFAKETLHLPGPDFVDRIFSLTDRPLAVLRNYQTLLNHGRLGGTGYVSISIPAIDNPRTPTPTNMNAAPAKTERISTIQNIFLAFSSR